MGELTMSENLFTIELGRYGFMLDTEWCYIALSWQLLIASAIVLIAYKIYKRTRKKNINKSVECNTTSDANIDLWGSNE
jgi:hypothetical protein